jgi:hypothetical protein
MLTHFFADSVTSILPAMAALALAGLGLGQLQQLALAPCRIKTPNKPTSELR